MVPPVLSPWIRDVGFGEATGCATADFGAGASTPPGTVATWPYAGQTGVPRSFDGSREGPEPTQPPGGWPSGYPITIFTMTTLTEHTLTVASSDAAVAHIWIAPGTPEAHGLLDATYVLYAESPLAAGTTYKVHVAGAGGAGAIDFTFTTQ